MTIFLGGGGAGDFCGYFWGVTSKLDNFYGLFLQTKCSCVCSVMESTLMHT